MKNIFWSVIVFAALGAASVGGLCYSQFTANAGATAERKVLHYVDPMHSAYTSPKPGIAPDCGMPLEPVYADTAAATHGAHAHAQPRSVVNASAEQRRLLGVGVAPVERSSGSRAVRLFGRVAAEETRLYKINIGVSGYIRDISAATTGSYVRKGQYLATFSSPDTRQPIVAYLTSLDVLDRATKNQEPAHQMSVILAGLDQNVDRLLTMGASPAQLEEIRRTRIIPAQIRVAAPAAGIVLARSVTAGQKVEMDSELFQIADLSKVWIFTDASGLDPRDFHDAVEADVKRPGHIDTLRARISERLPVFDPATQTLKIRLEVDNADFILRPDMLVDVELRVPTPPAITVPRDAVVQTGLEAIVFVERGEGQFEPRRVQTGWRSGDRVEIARGLEPGERVATSGTFLLDSDRRMRVTAVENGGGQ